MAKHPIHQSGWPPPANRIKLYFPSFRTAGSASGTTIARGFRLSLAGNPHASRRLAPVASPLQNSGGTLRTSLRVAPPYPMKLQKCKNQRQDVAHFFARKNSSQRNRLTVMFTCGQTSNPPGQALRHSRFHLRLTAPPTHRPSVQYLNYFTKPITRHTWLNTKIPMKK